MILISRKAYNNLIFFVLSLLQLYNNFVMLLIASPDGKKDPGPR